MANGHVGSGKFLALYGAFSHVNIIAGLMVASLALPSASNGQSIQSLQNDAPPLTLESMGSFYVGGHAAERSATEIGLYDGGQIIVDQMYVQFIKPAGHTKPPVVLIHGAALTGKSFETTPDGRMGWYEYFARKGYPSYVVDQVARGRSGFDPAPYNKVRAGVARPASQPNMRRVASHRALVRFRIRPEDRPSFADTQFPISAATELAKQTVPDLSEGLTSENPNFAALAELATNLKGAILIGHSQGGQYPFEAALLAPSYVRGVVAIEPAGCKAAAYTSAQIAILTKIPILVVFGDHIDSPQKLGVVKWADALADCQSFVERVNKAGGTATLYHLPDLGLHGNSHMMMQDRNNLQIADLIMSWIDATVRRTPQDGEMHSR